MKQNVIRFALLVFVLGAVGCADLEEDEDDDKEIQSFSSYVRDVFEESENEDPESVIEGKDFEFQDSDEMENYNDLLDS